MVDELEQARAWRDAGHSVALATVVKTWGSSPRPAGSHLVVRDDMLFVGSVSGGCIEGNVVEAALDTLSDGQRRVLEYGVSNARAWEVGLACGGRVKVLVEAFPSGRSALDDVLEARAEKRPVVSVHPLQGDAPTRLAGDHELQEGVREALRTDEARLVDDQVFLRPHNPPLRLLIVGAVHIAQPLARFARETGYHVVIVDPRSAFAAPERFPDVELVDEWPDDGLDALGIDTRTAVVTLTHDPKLDDPGLLAALASPAFYVGALGSTRTQKARRERLAKAGVGEADLARIHGPVGLDIGARSPAEIAVSILAEITRVLRGGAG